MKTAQRVSADDPSDGFVLARSVLAYLRAAELVHGDVLEIGTGTGYGVSILAPVCRSLTTVDKSKRSLVAALARDDNNVTFRRMNAPPLDFPDATFDCVVSFQVIEHIRHDRLLMAEIARVLKPGGRLVISTPNRAMSLTRNPWHVREYSPGELRELISGAGLRVVEAGGVFGGGRAMEYYERNRLGVRRFVRWDFLRLRDRLPRWLLRVPYDVANRLNRRALASASEVFTPDDYFLAPATDQAFDLFYVATKN